jgi:hypothetical protein
LLNRFKNGQNVDPAHIVEWYCSHECRMNFVASLGDIESAAIYPFQSTNGQSIASSNWLKQIQKFRGFGILTGDLSSNVPVW